MIEPDFLALRSSLVRYGLPWWLSIKKFAYNARDARDVVLIPGSGRSLGGGHGKPFHYSCLENSMDRGAWLAMPIGSLRVGHD